MSRRDFFPQSRDTFNYIEQIVRMFKPSTRHNIVPGAGPSGYSEVKLNGKGSANGQSSGRYQYRLNLWVPSLLRGFITKSIVLVLLSSKKFLKLEKKAMGRRSQTWSVWWSWRQLHPAPSSRHYPRRIRNIRNKSLKNSIIHRIPPT